MPDEITQQIQEAQEAIRKATSTAELTAIEVKYLGKKGSLNELRRAIGTLPAEERPAFGARINESVATVTATLC